MNTWTIGKRIVVGFSILIVMLVGIGIYSLIGASRLSYNANDLSANWLPGIVYLSKIELIAKDAKGALLENMITTDDTRTAVLNKQFKDGLEQSEKLLKEYKEKGYLSVPPNPDEEPLYDKTMQSFDDFRDILNQVNALASQNKNTDAYALYVSQGQAKGDSFLKELDAELTWNMDHGTSVGQNATSYAVTMKICITLILVVSTLFAIGFATVTIRSTNTALRNVTTILSAGSREIASAAGQVSASGQTLAEGASEQAANLEETSASMVEIGSMTKRNSTNATQAQELSNLARMAAETGTARTDEMQKAMAAIKEASQEMADAIAGIKNSSDSVGKIIKTIDEIAFQTNILALNAAVEAARAGEAGSGFAVVAEEVRNLAQRSALAAKETASMIEASVSQSLKGVEVNEKVNSRVNEIDLKAKAVQLSLTDILSKTKEVEELISTIATASREQTTGLEQISTAISQMDQITQHNAASAEESAAAAEELNAQSLELVGAVRSLSELVDGAGEPLMPLTSEIDSKLQQKHISTTAKISHKDVAVTSSPRLSSAKIKKIDDKNWL